MIICRKFPYKHQFPPRNALHLRVIQNRAFLNPVHYVLRLFLFSVLLLRSNSWLKLVLIHFETLLFFKAVCSGCCRVAGVTSYSHLLPRGRVTTRQSGEPRINPCSNRTNLSELA